MIIRYKKKILLLTVIALLTSGVLPYSFSYSKNPEKNYQTSQTQLCCCGNNASCCQDCGCSDGLAENSFNESDNSQYPGKTVRHLVTITACGGGSDDIFIAPELNYFYIQSSYINYLPVTTSSEIIILGLKNTRLEPPYKPPKA